MEKRDLFGQILCRECDLAGETISPLYCYQSGWPVRRRPQFPQNSL